MSPELHAEHFRLYGTHKTETPPVRLTAGRLSADLSDGNLRGITYDGVEVLRGLSFLVRDRDWGTYAPIISDLKIDSTPDAFSVSYTVTCDGPDGTRLSVRATIEGRETDLSFTGEALSATGFETNRCGFCILHPIVGLSGSDVTLEQVDGTRTQTTLPDLIEPWQPFKDMRALTTPVLPGVTAECRMEGDTFEMEDQRNWSDASYKTYVRPLALPWPYRIEANEDIRQSVTVSIRDSRQAVRANPLSDNENMRPVAIRLGENGGTAPRIGVVITPEEADATLAAHERLAALGVQDLLFHYDPLAGHGKPALQTFATIAGAHIGKTTLEIAAPCRSPLDDELGAIASMMLDVGFTPDAIVVSPSVDRQSTPPGSAWPDCPPLQTVYDAARRAFPNALLGGGMLSYFTELNRKRVPADTLDFITHCTNPIVHAADDLSVMQTLEALPFITRSVRAIYGDLPYRIGPSTIPMRQNPYGSRTMDNPHRDRVPMAHVDPRHNAQFAAAFALGYAARVMDAGLDCLTLSALTGPFGLIAGKDEPVETGGERPLAAVVRMLAALSGKTAVQCVSSDPARVLALCVREASGMVLLLSNVTPHRQNVDLGSTGATGQIVLPPYGIERITI